LHYPLPSFVTYCPGLRQASRVDLLTLFYVFMGVAGKICPPFFNPVRMESPEVARRQVFVNKLPILPRYVRRGRVRLVVVPPPPESLRPSVLYLPLGPQMFREHLFSTKSCALDAVLSPPCQRLIRFKTFFDVAVTRYCPPAFSPSGSTFIPFLYFCYPRRGSYRSFLSSYITVLGPVLRFLGMLGRASLVGLPIAQAFSPILSPPLFSCNIQLFFLFLPPIGIRTTEKIDTLHPTSAPQENTLVFLACLSFFFCS